MDVLDAVMSVAACWIWYLVGKHVGKHGWRKVATSSSETQADE